MKGKIGVYSIKNKNTGKYYIGSTLVCFYGRRRDHFSDLRRGDHHSKKLQRSFNKHGEASFEFEVLQECDKDNVRNTEQEWLTIIKPFYNMTLTVGTIDSHTYDTKLKISEIQGGKPIDVCDLKGKVVKTVNLQREAAEYVNGNQSKVWRCLTGRNFKHKGHRFKYSGEVFVHTPKKRDYKNTRKGQKHTQEWKDTVGVKMARGRFKGVLNVYKNNVLISRYLSIKEAIESLQDNLKNTGITKAILSGKSYKGYIFKKQNLETGSPVSEIERGFKG